MRGVTVLLPVHQADDSLRRAFACITSQTHRDLDILIVLNGADGATADLAATLAGSDPRARVISLPRANLAAALNRGLREARHDLVARMDADDLCTPERVERQVAFLAERPDFAGVGCAWEQQAPDGRVIATIRPATDPAELRWRLLVANDLAHGSMLLRRPAVLAAGGYDESRARAQDHDLWIRLSRQAPIGALPEVLYTHRLRSTDGPYSASDLQAAHGAEILTDAWASLPALDEPGRASLSQALGAAMSDPSGTGADRIGEFLIARGPSREGLTAWLWARAQLRPLPARALDLCKRSRLREVGSSLRAAGAGRVWLWGAGSHTAWLLDHRDDLGVPIAGIADDTLSGQTRFGFGVVGTSGLRPGDHVLISSDAHEDAIWESSIPARRRGVRVWRLYADQPQTPVPATSAAPC